MPLIEVDIITGYFSYLIRAYRLSQTIVLVVEVGFFSSNWTAVRLIVMCSTSQVQPRRHSWWSEKVDCCANWQWCLQDTSETVVRRSRKSAKIWSWQTNGRNVECKDAISLSDYEIHDGTSLDLIWLFFVLLLLGLNLECPSKSV